MSGVIAAGSVVTFHYQMKDEDGVLLESSSEERPIAVVQGRENVVRGLDRALLGRHKGDSFTAQVRPEEGYGLRREGWTQRMSKKHLPRGNALKAGMQTAYRTERGFRRVTVVKVGGKMVDVDLNHPLAGKHLTVDVQVVGVRDAEPAELAHGHAHGPGGHQH
ncbi:MAG: peptidylprolyl isomerase [Pseudomonadota bacterium]